MPLIIDITVKIFCLKYGVWKKGSIESIPGLDYSNDDDNNDTALATFWGRWGRGHDFDRPLSLALRIR